MIETEESQANHVKVTMTGTNPVKASHDVILLPFVQAKAPVPAWWVTPVRNAQEANMAWAVITDQSLDTVDVNSKCWPKAVVDAAGIFSIENKVGIPVLVNTKALAEGDELKVILPSPKRTQDEHAAAPITATSILRGSKKTRRE